MELMQFSRRAGYSRESDYGRSQIAQAKHSLFGFMAYDSSPFSITEISQHLTRWYEYRCPLCLASTISSCSGQFYNGKSMAAYRVRYASGKTWSRNKRLRFLFEILKKVKEAGTIVSQLALYRKFLGRALMEFLLLWGSKNS